MTLGGAVEAIGEDPSDPIRRLLLGRRALKLAIGLRKGHRTGLRGVAQMPEHAPTDNGRQVDFVCQTRAVLLIGEEIDGQWQTTPGQDRHQTVVAERTDQAIERHRREVADHRAPFQTETTMGGQQGIAGHVGSHLSDSARRSAAGP